MMEYTIYHILLKLRQLTYPREFRIGISTMDIISKKEGPLKEPNKPLKPNDLMNVDLIVSLCNDHYRLRRNVEQLEKEGKSSKELRSISRALKNIETLFDRYEIQCLDLTGQEYHVGRTDFGPLGEPEEKKGINTMKISQCERPAIYLAGKLIQQARGIVERPA
jgi:hypothetical protein